MMVTPTLLEAVRTLSITDKLALIASISQMLQDELQNKTRVNGTAQKAAIASESSSVKTNSQGIQALVTESLSRPKPVPDKMLRLGMFQGRIPTDEDLFKAAEWHPTDEELAGV